MQGQGDVSVVRKMLKLFKSEQQQKNGGSAEPLATRVAGEVMGPAARGGIAAHSVMSGYMNPSQPYILLAFSPIHYRVPPKVWRNCQERGCFAIDGVCQIHTLEE